MPETFPVAIGVCLDAEAIWLNKFPEGEYRPILLSHGTYAIHEGLDPLLALFRRRGVAATFYVPGITADRWPDAARKVRDAGHEIASHTYGHRSAVGMARADERTDMLRGIEAVERAVGLRPKTWRSASWEFSENTIDLMLEAGVAVSANFQDRSRPYRLVRDGA
ncbi:MAG: polysaccharide deacetylase family protein, partial [Alphaproteobacteria bacterium]